jgi:hypothetical protein
MKRKFRTYLAFDIEIANELPDFTEDWKSYRPLGISCAATLEGDGKPALWHGRTSDSEIANQMSQGEVIKLVQYLEEAAKSGYTIVTWNGLGFDFDVLGEESGMVETCKSLAMDHVDMMFHVFCLKGYGLSLDKAAKGMGLAGKPPGMDGSLAPKYWQEGRKKEVLDYVVQDVKTTLDLALAVERQRRLVWTSNRGYPQKMPLPRGWLPVRDAMQLPLPDTSWMRDPWSREKFTGWLGR